MAHAALQIVQMVMSIDADTFLAPASRGDVLIDVDVKDNTAVFLVFDPTHTKSIEQRRLKIVGPGRMNFDLHPQAKFRCKVQGAYNAAPWAVFYVFEEPNE